MNWRIVIFLLLLGFGSASSAAAVNALSPADTGADLQFVFLEDVVGTLTLDQIRTKAESDWKAGDPGGPNFGFSDSAFWVRVDLHNPLPNPQLRLIEVGYPQLDNVHFFRFDGNELVQELLTGDHQVFSSRVIQHPHFVLPIDLKAGETTRVYIRSQTQGSQLYPLRLWSETAFFEDSSGLNKLQFFYFGSLSMMVILTLAIYLMLWEKTYLYYSLATLGYLLFFLTIRGYGSQHLWPDLPQVHSAMMLLSMPFLAIFSVFFARNFMHTQDVPWLDKLLLGMGWIEIVNFGVAVFADYNTSVRLSATLALPLWIVMFIAGPVMWWHGSRPAIYFTLAWALLTTGIMVTMLHKFGLIPNSLFAEYGMQLGSGVEAATLTIALAARIYTEREQKIRAQEQSLQEGRRKREAQSQLIRAVMHDEVTGLPNRSLVEMSITDQLRSFPEQACFVGVVRLTRFSEISKTLGMQNADSLLQEVAAYMNSSLALLQGVLPIERDSKSNHYLGRIENDCFGFLVLADELMQNRAEFEMQLAKIHQSYSFRELELEMMPKMGLARYPEDGKDPQLLLRHAYVALEVSQQKDLPYAIYVAQQDVYDEKRLTLMAELRKALADNGVELYYQPKLGLADGRVTGLETLIRWNHPARGFIPPEQFIPLAERTGVIRDLTRWVLKRALQDLGQLREQVPELTVAINLSSRNLHESDLLSYIENELARNGLGCQTLVLELTETAMMEEPESGINTLAQMRERGITLAIDDFGSGYSSLAYLQKVPAREIKIDRSFITHLASRENDRVIVKTTLEMCQNLGFKVVAEGVEEEASLQLLKHYGCDMAQGYFICRPQPLQAIRAWLEKRL